MLKALLEREVLLSYRKADGRWAIDFTSSANSETRLRGMLPSSVREVIRGRLAQLSAGAFALLAAGAVLGQGFTFEHACRVADLRESEGLPALDEVLMSQILQEAAGQGEALYFFAHDKIRDVIYTEAGELMSEWEQVEAIYQSMLTLAQGLHSPEMECAALNRLATLAVHKSFDLEQAMSLLQSALQVAEHSGDTSGLAETEWGLAQLNYYRFDAQAALLHGNLALDGARRLGQQDLTARCLNVCAHARLVLGDWREAEKLAREASMLYRKLGNRPLESDCLCQVAMACTCDGRYQAGLAAGQQALAISKEIENYWGQVDCHCQLAMGSLEAGTYSEALSHAQRAVDLSRSLGVSILLNASLTILGRVLRTMLDLAAALAAHLEIIEATKALFVHTFEMTTAELCVDYAQAEKWDEAHTYALQALANRLNSPYLYMGLTRWYETEALARAGELERAVEDVQRFETCFGKSRRHRIPYLRSLAVLANYRGESDLAIVHLREAAQLAEEIGLPGELWSIWAALGDLYLTQSEDEQAMQAYREAARLVHTLATNIKEHERRKTYLSSPPVQRVLQAASRGE